MQLQIIDNFKCTYEIYFLSSVIVYNLIIRVRKGDKVGI